jgi:hypothetical protein
MIWGKYGFHWKTLQILPPRFLTYYFLKGGGIWGCSLAIRRSLRDEIFPIPPCWNHDAWISFLSSTITSIIALPESLIKYRQHSLQYIGVKPSRPLNNIHLIKALKRKNYHVTANLWKIALQRILTDKSNHASPVLLLEIENKIKFMEDRALIAKSKITRLPLILRDLFKGNYNIYSEYPAKAVITDMLYI